MCAKRTSKNRLTLPRAVAGKFPGTNYFNVRPEGGRILPTPDRIGGADAARRKLAALGTRPNDATDAVSRARR
jgi:hypothetical protein